MSYARVHARALVGLSAPPVTVEVHLANGLPAVSLVGLADTGVKEARERVRAALLHAGLPFPHDRRVTVNLAPADLPKGGARFDLPIALGILAAAGHLDAQALSQAEFAGELSLAGELRPVPGAVALAAAVRAEGSGRTLVLPWPSALEAAHVGGLPLAGAHDLAQVVAALRPPPDAVPLPRPVAVPPPPAPPGPDLREVRGQAAAKRALEVAAAGRHALLFVGPPGSGKSMLARRLPGLLPPLTPAQSLASAALLSLAGEFRPDAFGQRVVRAPHHGASAVSLVGGGSPPRPGEISLAHHGVLFLDELPEFPRAALESLREPLETAEVLVTRAARQARFPCDAQWVAAMNPCPCGHRGSALQRCRCTPDQVARYQGRLSGPLLDRLDLQVEVPAQAVELLTAPPDGDDSATVAARVARALAHQTGRQGVPNARLDGDALARHATPDAAGLALLHASALRWGWSGRAVHRVQRVARTLADLAGEDRVGHAQVAEAVQFRRVLVGG